MKRYTVTSLNAPGLAVYAALTEAQLRSRLEPEKGVFIAESPKVIRVAMSAGYEPLSLLCERRHLTGDAADIVAALPQDCPVYTGERELLASLTGYTLTRGVLCAMRRPKLGSVAEICKAARRVVCWIMWWRQRMSAPSSAVPPLSALMPWCWLLRRATR